MVIIKLGNTGGDDITKFESRVQGGKDALKARVDSNGESLKGDIAKFEARMNEGEEFNEIIKSIISNNNIIIKEPKYELKNQKINPVLEEIIKGLYMTDSNLNPIDKKNITDKTSI